MMKEKNIREMARRMNLVTINDMCRYSIPQLVVMIANKVNELIGEVGRFESDVIEVVTSQNENIKYLLDKGLHLEVANVFDGWVKDGTFDTLINHSALKKVNERIDETNAQLSQKTNEIITKTNQEISDLSNKTRIFKPKVYAYLSQGTSGSVVWETYVDEATYREHLNAMKKAGCDGFTLCLQIQPSKEQRDNFANGKISEDELIYRAYPSFDNVKLLKALGDEIGVPLVGIKFHNNWIRDNEKPLTFSKWIEQYTTEAYKFADEFIDVKYFSILNESKTIINTVSNKTKIKTLIDQLKKKGFIVGFSGVNDFDYDYDDYVNGIFIHTYPTISNKGKSTTFQDGVIGWESYGILETLQKMRRKHPDKHFMISETGVQNYWEALSLPEQNFNVNNVLVSSGEPSAIYFYGMFETLKSSEFNYLDSVWLFYTNPILKNTQDIIKRYTNGGGM